MRRKALETIIGGFVLLAAIAFVVYAFSASTVGKVQGYELQAEFGRVDGVQPGSEVRMSGIKIGSVLDSKLDPLTYLAIVRFNIAQSVQIPTDSSVRILSDGLLGDAYLSIEPGGSDTMFAPGDMVTRTQDSINILDALVRLVGGGGVDSGAGEGGGLGGGGLE